MIISHKHKFIYIKTKKTASTSIEIALSAICGPDDIITPITPRDEVLREEAGFRVAQNYEKSGLKYYNHISAKDVREMVGEEIWSSYYTFTFERNPFDKVISWYYWDRQFYVDLSLRQFFRSGLYKDVGGPGGYDLYTDNDEVIVDKIYLFEELTEALKDLAQRFEVDELPTLTRAKSEFRVDKRPYQEILSPKQQFQINEAFQREIKLFGYTY